MFTYLISSSKMEKSCSTSEPTQTHHSLPHYQVQTMFTRKLQIYHSLAVAYMYVGSIVPYRPCSSRMLYHASKNHHCLNRVSKGSTVLRNLKALGCLQPQEASIGMPSEVATCNMFQQIHVIIQTSYDHGLYKKRACNFHSSIACEKRC